MQQDANAVLDAVLGPSKVNADDVLDSVLGKAADYTPAELEAQRAFGSDVPGFQPHVRPSKTVWDQLSEAIGPNDLAASLLNIDTSPEGLKNTATALPRGALMGAQSALGAVELATDLVVPGAASVPNIYTPERNQQTVADAGLGHVGDAPPGIAERTLEMTGGMAPVLATGAAAPALGISQSTAAAGTFAAQSATDGYYTAKARGASEPVAIANALLQGGLGAAAGKAMSPHVLEPLTKALAPMQAATRGFSSSLLGASIRGGSEMVAINTLQQSLGSEVHKWLDIATPEEQHGFLTNLWHAFATDVVPSFLSGGILAGIGAFGEASKRPKVKAGVERYLQDVAKVQETVAAKAEPTTARAEPGAAEQPQPEAAIAPPTEAAPTPTVPMASQAVPVGQEAAPARQDASGSVETRQDASRSAAPLAAPQAEPPPQTSQDRAGSTLAPDVPTVAPEAPRAAEGAAAKAGESPAGLRGRASELELPSGKPLPVTYEVVEADSITPSHDARRGFTRNPGGDINERDYADPVEGKAYRETVEKIAANPKPGLLLTDTPSASDGPPIVGPTGAVLGGNARSMGVQLVYHRGGENARRLKSATAEAATRFGIDAASVEGMAAPVLVRRLSAEHAGAPGEMSRVLNVPLTTAKTANTEAVSRGSKIDHATAQELTGIVGDGTLRDALNEPGKASRVIQTLVRSGAFSEGDVTALVDNRGIPTQAGKDVIEQALLGSVVTDLRTLSEMSPAMRNATLKALPSLVRIKAAVPEFGDVFVQAAQAVGEVRQTGRPFEEVRAQATLPGIDVSWKSNERAVALARRMLGDTQTEFARRMNALASAIDDAANGQGNLFAAGPQAPDALLDEALGVKRTGGATVRQGDGGRAGESPAAQEGDIADQVGGGAELFSPGRQPAVLADSLPPDPITGKSHPQSPISADMRGRLEQPSNKVDPTSAPDVIEALANVVEAAGGKTPIRWGRLGRRMALGVFKVRPETIRVRTANDIATATHEVGHAIEKHIYDKGDGSQVWIKPLATRDMQAELVALGKALYGDRKPTGGYKSEGFAEFLRLWTTTEDSAAKAPKFHAWFEGQFFENNPEVAKALRAAREKATAWREQGSMGRAQASIVEGGALKERVKRIMRGASLARVQQLWVDSGKPLETLQRAALEQTPDLDPSDLPYNTFREFQLLHDARVAHMVEKGMVDLDGNVVGPALNDIRPLIIGRGREFTAYLWAKRTLALGAERSSGLSIADARQIVKELDSPQFQLAASKLYEWQDGALSYAAQASPTIADTVKRIRAADPGFYIPLQREFDEFERAWASKGTVKGGGSALARLKGSGRRIKDPLPQIIANTRKLVLAAHQRRILDQIIQLSRVEGIGHMIEEVPVSQVKLGTQSVDEALRSINGKLAELGMRAELTQDGEIVNGGSGVDEAMQETMPFFGNASRPDTKDPVIPYFDGSQTRWFQVDASLYRTLSTLDVYRLPQIVDLVAGVPTRLFRAGTTGLRATFGLVRNPIRDLPTLYLNSRAHRNGGVLFGDWLKTMGQLALNKGTAGKYSNPWIDTFESLGGEMAMPLGQDIAHTRRAARRLSQGMWERTLDPRNAYDWFREFIQFPEAAPRIVEMKSIAREVGWKPGEKMSRDQAQRMLLALKSVTTDFTSAGELSRVANQIIPFFNAAIQGPRATIAAAREHPGRYAWRGLQLTAATVALWAMNRDEDWWKETPDAEKFAYWYVPVEMNGRKEIMRIPRPYEIGGFFSALPEALLDSWYRSDPDAAKSWAKQFADSMTPDLLPQVARVGAEELANKEFFTGAPIVPKGEQYRAAEEQSGPFTTEVANFLGDSFGWSPRRIDHVLKGTIGGAGMDAIQLAGLGAQSAPVREGASSLPVVGTLFRSGGARGARSKSVEALYSAYDEALKRQASKRNPETLQERDVRLMLDDAVQAVSALSSVRWDAPDEARRNAAHAEMLRIAREAVEAAANGSANPKQFERDRKIRQRERDAAKSVVLR